MAVSEAMAEHVRVTTEVEEAMANLATAASPPPAALGRVTTLLSSLSTSLSQVSKCAAPLVTRLAGGAVDLDQLLAAGSVPPAVAASLDADTLRTLTQCLFVRAVLADTREKLRRHSTTLTQITERERDRETAGSAAYYRTLRAPTPPPTAPTPIDESTDTDASLPPPPQPPPALVALLEQRASATEAADSLASALSTIAGLQTTFAARVAEQSDLLATVHSNISAATCSVSSANRSLADATKSGLDLRFFLVLFLLTSSFSLLFLDWYN
jgi:hypothetical protein